MSPREFLKVVPAFARGLFWLCTVVVTILSLIPIEQLPPQLFNWWDKGQHALAFFVLAVLGGTGYTKANRWKMPCGLLVLGATIEVLQVLSGWRYGELADLAADVTGIAAALLVQPLINQIVTSESHKED